MCVICFKDIKDDQPHQAYTHSSECPCCGVYSVWHRNCVLRHPTRFKFPNAVCVNGCIPLPPPWGPAVSAQFTQAIWD